MTPSQITWSVDNIAPFSSPTATTWAVSHFKWENDVPVHVPPPPCNDFTVLHTGTPMADSTGASEVCGRYFQYHLDLYSRSTAAEVDPSLAPRALHPANNPCIYFGAYRPVVNRIEVHYFACAALVESRVIAPTSIKRWGTVSYRASRPSAGSAVTVDVLAPDGTVLAGGVAPGDSLAAVDPYKHPSLKLRATLASDPADCAKRPELEYWQVSWEPVPQILVLDRNGIRPAKGDVVRGQVRVDRPGRVTVQVHDAAGQAVKLLMDDDQPAQAAFVVWDGRNGRGESVAPGVYFISARVPGAEKVRRVAVIR
jgi:hypothetical protein